MKKGLKEDYLAIQMQTSAMGLQINGQFCGWPVWVYSPQVQLIFFFFLCSYIAVLVLMIVPSSSPPADWPCILLCVMTMKQCSHISGRDRLLQTILFFSENVHFYKCAYLHTDVYILISAAVHKDLELASWNTARQLSSLQSKGNKVKLTSHTYLSYQLDLPIII